MRAQRLRTRCRRERGDDAGARRDDSGLLKPSWVTPRLENGASVSSLGVGVSTSSVAPTEITNGSLPGRVLDGVGRVAAVAGGGDDDDAGVPRELDGRVERVVEVGARRVRADRQVDDPDVQLVLVVDDELQRVDDVEHGRVAGVVGGLDRDQVGLGGDADVVAAAAGRRRRG